MAVSLCSCELDFAARQGTRPGRGRRGRIAQGFDGRQRTGGGRDAPGPNCEAAVAALSRPYWVTLTAVSTPLTAYSVWPLAERHVSVIGPAPEYLPS